MMFESEESEEGQGLLFECHLQTSNCGPIVSKAASPLDFALQATQMLLNLDLLFSNLCLLVFAIVFKFICICR